MKTITFIETSKLEKMSRPRNGFAIILTLVLIVLVGTGVFVLTGVSNTLMFEADYAQVVATERNLTTSGLAWAKLNVPKQTDEDPIGITQLDVEQNVIADANLSVAFEIDEEGKSKVLIKTRCHRGRHTLGNSHKVHLR